MKLKQYITIFLTFFCFFIEKDAVSQIRLEWDDPRRNDTVMVLDVYKFKNNNFIPIFEITKNMSHFFQFAKDTSLNIYYEIFFRSSKNKKIEITVYSSQTSEMCFSMLWLYGQLPQGILFYDSKIFIIDYWHKDKVIMDFIVKNFHILEETYGFKRDGRTPKYKHSDFQPEGFLLKFEYDLLNNDLKLIETQIRNVQ